jgi:predicted transcriptional regulator
MQPDHVSQFIAAIKDFAPDMVVLDTLAVCELGGDENSTRDMTIMLDACRRIIRETGAAVVLVHHTGKNGTSERGASALRAQCDHMVELSAEDYGVKVTDSKQRDRACFDPYYLRPVQAGDSLVLLPSDKVVQTAADRLTPRQAQALEALALETFVEAGAKATQIAEVAHIPTDNIHRVLSALKRLGYVQQDVKGDPYRITEAGLSRLSSPSFYRHDGHDGWTPGSSVTVSHRHPPLGVTETTVTTDGVGKLLKTTETTVTSSETTVVSEPQATATVRSPQATKPSGRQRLPSNDSHDGDDSRSPGTLGKQITVPEIQWYASQVGVKYTYDMTGEALYKLYCAIPDRQRRAFEDYLPSDLAARLADYRQGQLRLLRKEVSRES